MEKLFETQGTPGLFLIFFIPGFITLKVYDLLVSAEAPDFSKSLFDAVAYSSLNFAALLWLIGIVRSGNLPPWLWYTAMFVLLIGMKRTPYWVRVHLKDQRRIGGRYAGKSFTSHSPAPAEIYLEEVWNVDENGGFTGSRVE
jgi:hypothetical protein